MLVKKLVFAAAMAVVAGAAHAADIVTLRLEWAIGGGHGPFYLAKERGYFTEEGIDIDITPGNGSSRTVAIIGSKGAMFGISDGASLIRNVAQGLPVKMVGAVANMSPFGLGVRKDSGITTIKEIEGHSLAFTAGSAQASVWPAIMQINGVDASKVNMVNMDFAGAIAAVANSQVQGQLVGVDGQPLVLEDRGIPMTTFLFSELGLSAIGKGIIVHDDMIKENPDLIRRFLKAVKKGFEEAAKSPDEAARLAVAAQDAAARQTEGMLKRQMLINLDLIHSANTKRKPFLTMDERDWAGQLDALKQYGDLQTDLMPTAFFTNEFVPQ